MPKKYTKTQKKKYTKKPRPKKTVAFKDSVVLGKAFPKKMIATHKYVDLITMTASSGTIATRQYVCNGMYDPDYSGVGHQPYMFDQLSAIYNHYTVIGSKITVKNANYFGPDTAPGYWVALEQNDDGSISYSALSTMSERPDGKCKLIPAGNTTQHNLVNKWSAKKTFGGSVMANDNLQGTVSSNPAEITNWVIGIQALDSISTINTSLVVEIEYIAVWDELKEIGPS